MKKQPMKVLSFRITKKLHKLLTEKAHSKTVGLGAVIRWALERYFEIEEDEGVPTRVQRQTEEQD